MLKIQNDIAFKDMKIGYTYPDIYGILLNKPEERWPDKSKQHFLILQVSDGESTITVKKWQWNNDNPTPDPHRIIYFPFLECKEYNGSRDFTLETDFEEKEIVPTEILNEFREKSNYDLDEIWNNIKNMINKIHDSYYKEITLELFEDHEKYWKEIPGGLFAHHNYLAGTLIHSYNVARVARAIANVYDDDISMDLVTAGALLHDIGKLWTYKYDVTTPVISYGGSLLDHIIIGSKILTLKHYQKMEDIKNKYEKTYQLPSYLEKIVDDYQEMHPESKNHKRVKIAEKLLKEKIILLEHIIASHHGTKEWGSPITPRFMEAWIVHMADNTDAKCEAIRSAANPLKNAYQENDRFTSEAVFVCDKKQQVLPQYIRSVVDDKPRNEVKTSLIDIEQNIQENNHNNEDITEDEYIEVF